MFTSLLTMVSSAALHVPRENHELSRSVNKTGTAYAGNSELVRQAWMFVPKRTVIKTKITGLLRISK